MTTMVVEVRVTEAHWVGSWSKEPVNDVLYPTTNDVLKINKLVRAHVEEWYPEATYARWNFDHTPNTGYILPVNRRLKRPMTWKTSEL